MNLKNKDSGDVEPECPGKRDHYWIARSLGGVGYIEEKVCGNCSIVAHRTPPTFDAEDNLVLRAGYRYSHNP